MTFEEKGLNQEPLRLEPGQIEAHNPLSRENIVNVIKLARPRTWFFIYYSYLIGWVLGGSRLSFQFLLGLIICVLSTANVNLLNAYTDIEEDQVNLPGRVMMIDRLGLGNLKNLVILMYIGTSGLSLLMPSQFIMVYALSVFDTVFYSLEPLRFKMRPFLSMLSFSGAVFLPGVAAWTLSNSVWSVPPLIVFLGYFFLSYCVLKNLPDYEGDKYAGLRTSATIFSTKKKASQVASIVLASPFLLLACMVYLGVLETRYAALFIFLPLVLYLCRLALRGDSYDEFEKLHTYGLVYVVLVLVSTLFLAAPTMLTLIYIATSLLVQAVILIKKFDSR